MSVRVVFKGARLKRIDSDRAFAGGYPSAVVSAYRGRIQVIRAAPQEQVLLKLRSLQMEPSGNGKNQHSMRVTDDWELIVGFEQSEEGRIAVVEAMVKRTRTNTESPS